MTLAVVAAGFISIHPPIGLTGRTDIGVSAVGSLSYVPVPIQITGTLTLKMDDLMIVDPMHRARLEREDEELLLMMEAA